MKTTKGRKYLLLGVLFALTLLLSPEKAEATAFTQADAQLLGPLGYDASVISIDLNAFYAESSAEVSNPDIGIFPDYEEQFGFNGDNYDTSASVLYVTSTNNSQAYATAQYDYGIDDSLFIQATTQAIIDAECGYGPISNISDSTMLWSYVVSGEPGTEGSVTFSIDYLLSASASATGGGLASAYARVAMEDGYIDTAGEYIHLDGDVEYSYYEDGPSGVNVDNTPMEDNLLSLTVHGLEPGDTGVLRLSVLTNVDAECTGVAPIPEPATVLLLGTGLVGLVGFRNKFKK